MSGLHGKFSSSCFLVPSSLFGLAFLLFFPFLTAAQTAPAGNSAKLRFEISFPESASAKPLDGHILLGISKSKDTEPRFQLREEEAQSAQFFGLDVDALKPGASAIIDSTSLGYPLSSLDQLSPGDYYVQAVLNIYETFHRADGHTIKLPPDMGEGQPMESQTRQPLQQTATRLPRSHPGRRAHLTC
jgi:hypothetical protein